MKRNRLLMIGVLAIVLAAVITGCSTATTTPKNTINIQGSAFSPASITIKVGDTVTWVNKDSVGHTVVFATFQSALLDTGQSYKMTFNEAGTFDYHCSVHPSMVGKVIVTSGAY